MPYQISALFIDDIEEPLGLDDPNPLFSWKYTACGPMKQKAYRIMVGTRQGGRDLWDSGRTETDRSFCIRYEGKRLHACTRYYVTLLTWDTNEAYCEAAASFETGLMDGSIRAWRGAQWIGAPELSLAADTLSVFTIESTIRILEGGRAGIVFGANDPRLLDRSRNESLLEGENYIRYVLDLSVQPARVEIFRVGYAPDDRADRPFAVFPAAGADDGKCVITEENRDKPHTLRIVVTGNCAYTWLDGVCIDREIRPWYFGNLSCGRQLNPLGRQDTTTYPRLCHIGIYVGEGSRASFDGLKVFNNRKPHAKIADWMPEGVLLEGETQKLHDPGHGGLPMLRTEFTLSRRPVRARLYTTARGIYECRINGRRTNEDYFAPGASQFDRHLMYQTCDVTEMILVGTNVWGCILSSGWWCDAQTYTLENYNFWGDRPSFLGMLILDYADGTSETVVSSPGSWGSFTEGPWRYSGFFNGEKYDARKEDLLQAFFRPGFTAKSLKRASVVKPVVIRTEYANAPVPWPTVNETEPELTGHFQAPVRVVETLCARRMTQSARGVYIYDLGQEIAGVPRLHFKEEEGRKITIRHGEMLYPPLPEYGELAGKLLQVNLRDASSTDEYICRGGTDEIYSPRFTFHGFRYIEISGVSHPPALSDVEGLLLSSVPSITGHFTCDNELVNRLFSNVSYSQRCNFISIPTDCPQRNERMGWAGDTHVFCHTAGLQAQVKNFYLRNLQAMRDLQLPSGRLPNIAPVGGGFGGITYESAMVLMVWELYQQYGDETIIREYYPCMDRWMNAMQKAGFPGTPREFGLGDWLAPVETDQYLIWNAFYYRDCVLMSRYASLLGRVKEAAAFEMKAQETKHFWNSRFVGEDRKTCGADGTLCDTQASYVIPLYYGVVDEVYRQDFADALMRKTRECGFTVQTGFFGTGPLNPVLCDAGYPEAAVKLMLQEQCPGWLYPVTQGATTVWERWDSYTIQKGFGGQNAMNSFNHYSLGSVLSWLYEYVLGIRRDEDSPGCLHFTLCPLMLGFQYAKGQIETTAGTVKSEWTLNGGSFTYSCSVPPNARATLILNGRRQELSSGTYTFTERLD